MARERKRDAWRRRLLGSKDRLTAATSQADDSKSVSSTPELAPAVLSPLRANTPAPTPTEQLEALGIQQREPQTPNDVWAAAFRKFQESDGDLAKAYAKAANPLHEGDAAVFDVKFVDSTIKELEEKRDERQWKVAFAGKSIHIRSQVEKMVKFLLWTDAVVKPALSAQPYAALAWSAVSIFLPLLNVGTELHDKMLTGLEGINHILVFWRISESSVYPFRGNASKDFYNVFVDLHRLIVRYYAYAVRHLSLAQASRAKENLIGWNGWEAETSIINKFHQNCQNYLEAAQRKTFQDSMETQFVEIHNSRLALEDIARRLEEIQFRYEDEIEGKILRGLHADFKGHKNANPERVQGTCKWVLQDPKFHQWRDSKSSSLLWISAGPGYGKSVLSRALIDSKLLKSPDRAATSSVCYFFFKDGDEKRTRACDAIAAILHQLFAQDLTGNLIKKAKAAYHSAGAGLRDSFDELWDIFISCITSPDAGEILCLLDALDECKQLERDRLVTCLNKFYNTYEHNSASTSSLKFIITSRPWKVIQLSLQGLFEPEHPSQSSHINGDDRLHEISQEIELVIEENLPAITGHLSQNDQEEIGEHLKAMKNRTYLWLRLVFQMVKQNPTEYTRKSDIIHLFESLPAEVSQVYEKVLRRSYNDPKTQLLFQLMLAAPQPLKLREADEAVTVLSAKTNQWKTKKEFHDNCWGQEFQSVVQNCTGFLVVIVETFAFSGSEYELSFVHQTVREFLLGPNPIPNSWKGRFSYSETQAVMLSACLKSLPILQLPSGYGFKGDRATEWLHYPYNFPFYAASCWPMHYELQGNDAKEELYGQARLLCDTSQPSTAAWLNCYPSWPYFRERAGLEIEDFDILTIAAYCGLTHLVEKITQTDAADFSQARQNSVSPLQAASWAGNLEAVKALIRNNADINYRSSSLGSPIECAICVEGALIVEFLLSCVPLPVVTEETLSLAANCKQGGGPILELLLQRYPDLEVPENVVQAAASNRTDASQMIEPLLRERRALIPSDETIYSAIENCGLDVLNALFHRRSDLHVTGKMVEKECARPGDALEMLSLLYERSPDAKVIDRALTLAAANENRGVDIVKFLSGKYSGLRIPQEAFHAAARNPSLSVEILCLLFELEDSEQVTPDLIWSAMCNFERGPATLDFLACRDGFNLTNGCFETWFQTSQGPSFYENASYSMRMGGDEITVTDTMMKGIVGWEPFFVRGFLKEIGTDFVIFVTDDIYNESRQACRSSRHPEMQVFYRYSRYKVMELLMGTESVDIQMKGKDGHPLTRNEAMEKLKSWKTELDDFYATDTDRVDDTLE